MISFANNMREAILKSAERFLRHSSPLITVRGNQTVKRAVNDQSSAAQSAPWSATARSRRTANSETARWLCRPDPNFIHDFKAFTNKTPSEFVAEMQKLRGMFHDHENVVFLQSPPTVLDYGAAIAEGYMNAHK